MNCLCSKSKVIYLILGSIIIVIIVVLIMNRIESPEEIIILATPRAEQKKAEQREIRQWNSPPKMIIDKNINYTALVRTTKGDIKIELFARENPITVNNFVFLSQQGFYNGIIFHRVINGFMIQGGCLYGTGMGGPGYVIPDEFRPENRNDRGTISMANAGANTGGSQFFINLVDNNFLDARHPVFGRVIEGMEIVDTIGKVKTKSGDRPVEDVIIKNIEII